MEIDTSVETLDPVATNNGVYLDASSSTSLIQSAEERIT